jgi:hypothetical protein
VVWDKIDSNFQDHIRNDLISIWSTRAPLQK